VPGSFVDENLAQHHSDLLFQLQLKNGDPAFAYLLLEHKSSPDAATALQLLRYIVRILAKWYDEHERLPVARSCYRLWRIRAQGTGCFPTAFHRLIRQMCRNPYALMLSPSAMPWSICQRIHDGALSADHAPRRLSQGAEIRTPKGFLRSA